MSITKQQFAVSLAKIINYLEADEAKNYASTDGVLNDHIYFDILKVRDYMLRVPDYKSDFSKEYLQHCPGDPNTCGYDKYKDKDCVVVESSHGEFYADLNTGEVIGKDICCDKQPTPDGCNHEYAQVKNFDFEEWKRFYKVTIPPQLDILDLGYWLDNGDYTPAETSYREEILNYMHKGDDQCQDIQT